MVNENKRKIYRPRAVYDRKLLRSVIRNQFVNQHGFHNVNRNLRANFNKIREGLVY